MEGGIETTINNIPCGNIAAAGRDMEKQKHYNIVAYIAANISSATPPP